MDCKHCRIILYNKLDSNITIVKPRWYWIEWIMKETFYFLYWSIRLKFDAYYLCSSLNLSNRNWFFWPINIEFMYIAILFLLLSVIVFADCIWISCSSISFAIFGVFLSFILVLSVHHIVCRSFKFIKFLYFQYWCIIFLRFLLVYSVRYHIQLIPCFRLSISSHMVSIEQITNR